MLDKSRIKLVKELINNKKTRRERGLFVIEGAKLVKDARKYLEFSFTDKDVPDFRELISTETPQSVAGVVRVPAFSLDEIFEKRVVLVLDGLQDPGNVGTILRAALAFNAAVILVESADPTNPKTVRSSAGAVLKTPWFECERDQVTEVLLKRDRAIYRLELRPNALVIKDVVPSPLILIAGNEGGGIKLEIEGRSVMVPQNNELESLNVAVAVSIALYELAF